MSCMAISPMNGVGPMTSISSLISRLMDGTVTEVIVATNATADREATSMYISRVLKPAGIKVTRWHGDWQLEPISVCGRSDLASRD